MLFTRDRDFYKNFFSLASIIVLQNVIVLSVNLADNLMIGGYSETALSGVAAVNQIQFVFQQIIMAVGDSLVVIGSQYWGQKRISPVKSLGAAALSVGLLFGAVLFAAAAAFPDLLIGIFTPSHAIVSEGVKYIGIIKYTYLIFAVTNILLALLRTTETVKISFFVSLSALITNCSINYILIEGRFGAPALGVRGAAIGTLAARSVELVIVVLYVFLADKKLKITAEGLFNIDVALAADYVKNCIFFVIVAAMFGCSTALQTVILGHMNDNAIAANSIASTLFQILKVASVGAASATAVIIGKTIGSGKLEKLREYVKTLQILFLIIGFATSVLLFLLRMPILSLYDITPETKAMAGGFILVLCVTCIGTAYEMPVITGIIRGGGDSKFVFINDLISIWGIVLPISFLAAFKWHAEPYVVIFLLNSDQIFKCAAAAIKVNRYRWIKRLTRDC